jgi:hypothetical protein
VGAGHDVGVNTVHSAAQPQSSLYTLEMLHEYRSCYKVGDLKCFRGLHAQENRRHSPGDMVASPEPGGSESTGSALEGVAVMCAYMYRGAFLLRDMVFVFCAAKKLLLQRISEIVHVFVVIVVFGNFEKRRNVKNVVRDVFRGGMRNRLPQTTIGLLSQGDVGPHWH